MAPGMFMPWTFVTPAAIPGIKALLLEKNEHNRLLKFCFCWLVLPFLFLSMSKGKLLTYILPCFPPFAILMAYGLLNILKKNPRNSLFQWGVLVNAAFFSLILIALLYVQFFGFNGFRPYNQSWKAVMVVNGLIFFTLFCFWSFRNRSSQTKLLLFGLAPLLLFFVIHFTVPDLTIEQNSPGPLLERYKQSITEDDVIISSRNSIGAVCWYLGRNDVYVLEDTGELSYGFGYQDAKERLLDTSSAADFIKQNRGKTILVDRVGNASLWRDKLPAPVFQDQNGSSGYMFRKY